MRIAIASWRQRLASSRLRLGEPQAVQVGIAMGCIAVSAFIGYAYAGSIHLDTTASYCWQLWTWAFAVAVIIIALLPRGLPLRISRREVVGLALLAAAAALPRVLALDRLGLHTDEQGFADFALRHVFPTARSTINPFITGAASHPTLYFYLARLSLAIFGPNITGLRLLSSLGGVLGVLATWAMVSAFQSRRTAWIAAMFVTASHFAVHWSRLGLNNIWDTVWVPLTLAAYAWGWKKRWSGGAVLAGAALGLGQYFYPGTRVVLPLLAWVVLILWRQDRDKRRLLVHTGKMLAVAVCIALPLVLFALRSPTIFLGRTREVYGWSTAAIVTVTGPHPNLWQYAWYQLWRSAGAYTAVPDTTGFYRPNVPFLIGLAAPLFLIGFVEAVRKRQSVPVVWILLATFLGGFMLGGVPGSSHLVVSIPAMAWLVALPIEWLFGTGRPHWAWAALILVIVTDLVFYFGFYLPAGLGDLHGVFPPGPFK